MVRFRLLFVPYALGLVAWLVLGLLPTVVADVGALHTTFLGWAAHSGFAARIVHPAMPGSMGPDRTTTAQALLQYAFSLLNLSLGLLLAARRPTDLVPRLLAFALLGTAATFNLPSHRAFHLTGNPWPIALLHFTFHIVSGTCYFWAVVLFPDGRLPERVRLSPLALRATVVGVTGAVALICWRSSFLAHPQFFVLFFGVGIALAGAGAQALRLLDPGTSPVQRQAARLLGAALLPALATALAWIGARIIGPSGTHLAHTAQTAFPAVFALVPVVLAAGVVRYRLWDLDRLVSRALTYGAIAAVVGVGYVGAVGLGAAAFGGGLWVTVAVLAGLAVLVEPVRIAARRWANRAVYGQELSPAEAIRTLIDGLERLAPTGELDQLTAVAVRATRADTAALWSRTASTTDPADGDLLSVFPIGALGPSGPHAWPVSYQGEQLGVLAVASDAPLTRADEALLADLAGHAGLVLHNAVLTTHLGAQVAALATRTEELRTARRRLVEAQDTERRRLERNLHDGAQQELVAAIAALGAVAATHPSPAERDRLTAELRGVLEDARVSMLALCGDGRPPMLVRLGLAGALEHSAGLLRATGISASVQVDAGEPLPEDVEAAIYFCCVEALQNVGKHAAARTVAVRVERRADSVEASVRDDGRGVAPGADPSGGLAALADRVAGVGGAIRVLSAPGRGTAVIVTLPRPAGTDPLSGASRERPAVPA